MNMKTMMQKSALRTERTWFRSGLLLRAAAMGVCMMAGLPVQAVSNVGSGGTVTYTDASGLNPSNLPYADGYVVHTFTATGTTNFTVPAAAGSLDIEYLLVGGGGSGGRNYGAGGGAGGLLTNKGGTPKSVAAGSYTVVIGNGGAGVSTDRIGNPGGTSSVFGLTALGGGGGGGNASDGGAGASGGGASKLTANNTVFSGGVCIPGQGNDGGYAGGKQTWGGGAGGGGAGGAGGSVTGSFAGGSGGIGLQNSLSGTTNWYAAGGSGVFTNFSASGIGGICQSGVDAGAGVANTGSGGGGFTAKTGGSTSSGAGGSGIVILRYRYVAEMPLLVRVTAPANNKGFYVETSISATATVANGTAPYTVTFYTNVNGGAFAQAGAPDDTEPYTVDLGMPSAGTYGIYTVATNASATVTSPTNTFTVATNNVSSGGIITYTDASKLNPRSSPPYVGGYVVHTFTTAGTNTLTIPGAADGLGVEYLLVGGGGSGGNYCGAGGGAGALRTNVSGTPLPVAAGTYEIIVGTGGAGVSSSSVGNPGIASSAFGLKANGGGGGGGANGTVAGGPGGSGGGGSGSGSTYTLGGPGNAGYGNSGGIAAYQAGGGGGGAGAVGGAATGPVVGGAGGVGLQNAISGTNAWYAAGGSGVFNATSASGIGGICQSGVDAGAGVANTGSGGGGFTAKTGGSTSSGAGGSGIVIVRYAYVYVISGMVATPSFSLPPGGYIGAQSVTLSCATPEAVIHYTSDGTTPTSGSPVYTTAIAIPLGTNLTIQAIGTKTDYTDSAVASAAYITGSSWTWTSTAGGSWPVAANWLNGIVVQGSGIPAKFDTLTLTNHTTVTLDGARTVGNLSFADVGNLYNWTINTGTLTLDTAGTSEISVSNRTTTIGAIVAGTNGLTKGGAGTLTLSGANSYTGTTTINTGTLKLQGNAFSTKNRTYSIASGAVLNIDGATDIATGTTTINGTGTLCKTGAGYWTSSSDLRDVTMSLGVGALIDVQAGASFLNGGWQAFTWTANQANLNVDGLFDVWNGYDVTVDALTGAGTITKGAGNPQTLTVGIANGSGVFSGTIANPSGSISLTKTGTGTQTLAGKNTYSGATTVNNGVLEVGINGSLGTNRVEVTGGKLSLLGSSAISDTAQLRLPDATDKLELATGVNETVGELYIGGEPAWRGTWGRIGNTACWNKSAAITGDGILTVTEGPKHVGTLIRFF